MIDGLEEEGKFEHRHRGGEALHDDRAEAHMENTVCDRAEMGAMRLQAKEHHGGTATTEARKMSGRSRPSVRGSMALWTPCFRLLAFRTLRE